MEAAQPLPFISVHSRGDEVVIDGLRVADDTLVRMVREREQRGENPDAVVRDALEIGARVLDRELTGAQADVVKAEFAALKGSITDRTAALAERMDAKVGEVFAADGGQIARIIARHFGDESSEAVQHRVRAVMAEAAAQMREDLRRQLGAEGDDNPIAKFHRTQLALMGETAKAHREELRAVGEKMEAMRLEVERLRSEREKLEEVAAEAERGTAKGRTYEEAVVDAIDAIAGARGDVAEGVGDEGAAGRGKKGDVLASLDACAGPARGRVVFEAKDTANLSRNKALEYLDEAMTRRDADYAVLVVPCEHLPAKTQTLREFNGDKLFVGWDPEDGPLALELAYGLARARVLARRGDADGLDADALRAEAERATQAMEDVRRIKSQLTGATTSIEEARKILDVMAGTVRGHLAQMDALLSSDAAPRRA